MNILLTNNKKQKLKTKKKWGVGVKDGSSWGYCTTMTFRFAKR